VKRIQLDQIYSDRVFGINRHGRCRGPILVRMPHATVAKNPQRRAKYRNRAEKFPHMQNGR
jgi:hypothetical protein